MPRRDDSISLQQMLDHAREAVEMISGKTFADLEKERMLEAGCQMLFLHIFLPVTTSLKT